MKPYIVFNGMTWPNPGACGALDWRFRYAPEGIKREDHLVAASVLSAYVELVSLPQRQRNRRIAQIRAAMKSPGMNSGRQEDDRG